MLGSEGYRDSHSSANKGVHSQSYGFSSSHVWSESWTIKKAECWKTDAFEPWCWRRLLRVPWTARRSNQSILKEINPKYSLEGLMLKLKLQCFDHLMWKAESLENSWCQETLRAGGEGGWGQRIRWLDGVSNSTDMSLSKLQERVKDRNAWHGSRGHKESDMTE